MSCDVFIDTPTSSYVSGGGRGGEEGEEGPDNLPLTLCMRYKPTTPNRTPATRNNKLHKTATISAVGPHSLLVPFPTSTVYRKDDEHIQYDVYHLSEYSEV